jgi:hypothetical protein
MYKMFLLVNIVDTFDIDWNLTTEYGTQYYNSTDKTKWKIRILKRTWVRFEQ